MKFVKKLLTLSLALVTAVGFTACGGGGNNNGGGGGGGVARVDFLYTGPTELMGVYADLVDIYNAGQGAEKNILVKTMPVVEGSLDGKLSSVLPVSSGPDVVMITDDYFKKHTSNLLDMRGLISNDILSDLYESQASRYRYDIQKTTSNPEDPIYGVPFYNDNTVLYYNKTALENAGVKVISVAEEDLAAFNAGTLKDANGKSKADYEITIDVPAKGFYRSINNYVHSESDMSGSTWIAPSSSEILIFNEKIACNWDEIEDVGLLLTKTRNSSALTDYGYYTEWWFNYGWSVGGDCIEDMSGNGDWTYSHADETPNYIVNEGATYTGTYTGTVYKAGETLDVKDVIANKGNVISYHTDSNSFYYTVNGERASVLSAVSGNKNLTQLPSIKEAFKRFCYLAGVGGLNVCPYPSAFNQTTAVSYFTSNKLAFLIEKVSNFNVIEKDSSFEWGIANLPVYKQYSDPTDPNCDEVVKQGIVSSHSIGSALCIRNGSLVQEQAIDFIEWLMTEGQDYLATNGYASSRRSKVDVMAAKMKEKYNNNNTEVIVQSLNFAKAGDWWYMPNKAWIDIWANPLNNSVRYGSMTFDDFIHSYIVTTNEALAAFKK